LSFARNHDWSYNRFKGLTSVILFANGGVITGRLMIILGADILMAGLLARKVERVSHDH
jgi:hypothetical protein